MSDNDLIRRSDALNALRLGETITKLQARIAALPTVTDLGKTQRIIAARDRRIARLVSALNDARAKGYVTPAEQEPALVLSAALAAQPAPSPWRPIETAPKDGTRLLLAYQTIYQKWRRVVAFYAPKFAIEGNDDGSDWCEYDEANDRYCLPEGWYECIENWDDYSSVHMSGVEPTHWMPLPPAPKEVE